MVAGISEIGCRRLDARSSGPHRRVDGDSAKFPRRDAVDWTGSRIGSVGKPGGISTREEDFNRARNPWETFLLGRRRNGRPLARNWPRRGWPFREEQRFHGAAAEIWRPHHDVAGRRGKASRGLNPVG